MAIVAFGTAAVQPARAASRSKPHRRSDTTAQASKPAPTLRTFAVNTHYVEPASQLDGVRCKGLPTTNPDCQLQDHGTATFTGTMWGDVAFDLTGSVTPDGKITYEGPDYINGGVVGCGKGSYIIDDTDGYVDMTKYDPITNTAPGVNKWTLRSRSGTGELVDLVSGHGENHWTYYFNGHLDSSRYGGEGDFTGTITCLV